MAFITEHWGAIVTALLALSEALALIPAVKANSIFQLIVGLLQKAKPAQVEAKK